VKLLKDYHPCATYARNQYVEDAQNQESQFRGRYSIHCLQSYRSRSHLLESDGCQASNGPLAQCCETKHGTNWRMLSAESLCEVLSQQDVKQELIEIH
jgi:hypothetical protein